MTKTISPADLIPMDQYAGDYPISIHLAYQKDAPPNIFGKIYRDGARLWLHKDLAQIVLRAAKIIHEKHGYSLVLYDGLRTTEAQEKMRQSKIVQANPQWLEEPGRLLSPPGGGAHPRGMAIDLSALDEKGNLLDMGTVFDHLAANSAPENNPAHRAYKSLGKTAAQNRKSLSNAMNEAAQALNIPLFPLPQEWWDFRLPAEIYQAYAPLSDTDLPPEMRMCS